MTERVQKPLTGRKVLAISLGAFGVIFTANMALVYAAIGSFPGLEVKNTYVASQVFDVERQAQIGLGWKVVPAFDGQTLTIEIKDKSGAEVTVGTLDITIGRATTDVQDKTLDFGHSTGPYVTALTLAPGKWEIRLKATARDGTAFHQRLPLIVN